MRRSPGWRSVAGSLVLLAGSVTAAAAPRPPVQWQVKSAPAKAVKPGSAVTVVVTGQPDPGWHLYALEEPDGGPVATEVALAEGDPADLLRVEESKPKVLPDANFGQPTRFFDGPAEFALHLRVLKAATAGPSQMHVLVRYQSCNDRVCLPPHTETIPVPLEIAR